MITQQDTHMQNIPAYQVPAFSNLLNQVKQWFFYMLRRWWIIFLVVLIAGSLGVAYAWMTKPKYESRLSFALEESGGGGLSGALSLAAEFGLNLGSSSSIFSGDNVLQIISSRRVIENVLLSVDSGSKGGEMQTMAQYMIEIKRKGKKPVANPKLSDLVNFPIEKQRSSFTYLEDSVLFVMYEKDILDNLIAARPDKKVGIYEIRFTSPDERFSKLFTEKLLDETTRFYTELRSKKSRQTLEVLEKRVSAMKQGVNTSIYGRSNLQDANLNPAFAAAIAPLQEKQVDLSAYSGAYAELFKNLELARFQYLQDVPLLQVIDDVQYPLKKIKKGRLMTGILFSFISGVFILGFLSVGFLLQKEKELLDAK